MIGLTPRRNLSKYVDVDCVDKLAALVTKNKTAYAVAHRLQEKIESLDDDSTAPGVCVEDDNANLITEVIHDSSHISFVYATCVVVVATTSPDSQNFGASHSGGALVQIGGRREKTLEFRIPWLCRVPVFPQLLSANKLELEQNNSNG